jgi:dTDP-4-amino-4,6-dideoxygalactose transaminase
MTSIQAVMGLRQLGRLSDYSRQRRQNAETLLRTLRELEALRTPVPPDDYQHAYYRLYSFVRPERLRPGWTRDRIVTEITSKNAPCFTGSCPEIYLEKAFRESGFAPLQRLPQALALGETSVAFLVDPCQTAEATAHTATAIRDVIERASLQ